MLFKRRRPPGWRETVRVAVWPRRSWLRSAKYVIKRVWRLNSSPHAIALGFACGVFVSFSPFIGLHFIYGALLALVLRGHLVASALGTSIGNPLTFPLIWLGTYRVGNMILGESGDFSAQHLNAGLERMWDGMLALSSDSMLAAMETLWPLLKPMAVGGAFLGFAAAGIIYYIIRRVVVAYQSSRRRLGRRETPASDHMANAGHEPASRASLSTPRR